MVPQLWWLVIKVGPGVRVCKSSLAASITVKEHAVSGGRLTGKRGTARAIARLEEAAEDSYARMYDARSPSDATAHYSDAKEAFCDAIAAATAAGEAATAERLMKRLEHIKAVFRSQFT